MVSDDVYSKPLSDARRYNLAVVSECMHNAQAAMSRYHTRLPLPIGTQATQPQTSATQAET